MKKMINTTIEGFKIEVLDVLEKYDSSNIDILFECEDDIGDYFCIIYHSRHNSFSASNTVLKCDNMTEQELKKIIKELIVFADDLDIGTCNF